MVWWRRGAKAGIIAGIISLALITSVALQTLGNLQFDIAILGLVIALFALLVSLRSVHTLSHQLALSSIIQVVEWMEKIRPDRHILYKIRPSKKPYPHWTKRQREAADRVSRWFDVLGVLDSTGNINRKFLDRFYAIPASEMWDICKQHVKAERRKRGTPGKPAEQHLWEFEQLATRVQNVRNNHPAISGSKQWPLFPRRKRFHL